jgi:RimJ/RimL family protein N-acetyltransferase
MVRARRHSVRLALVPAWKGDAMGSFAGVQLDDLVLTSARLTLRPWRASDAGAVVEIMRDRSMFEFLALPDPYTRAHGDAFVTKYGDEGRATGTGIGSAVIERSTGRLVGSAALRFPAAGGSTAAGIGYWVGATARGNGYAAEASRLLTDWAFAHGIARVEIRCATGNLASAKSALAAGFRFEGVLRGDGVAPAGSTAPVDDAVFGRLPADPDGPVAPSAVPPAPGSASDGVVELRPLGPADRDAVAELESDPETRRWALATAPVPAQQYAARVTAEAGLRWLVGPDLRFAIADVSTGRCAGTLSVHRVGPPHVGLVGYAVHPAFRGRGYTGRALRLLRAWAFDTAGFARLELGADAANVASHKVALAGGFEPDGVRRGRLRTPAGTFSDEVCFAVLNPRYR